jgi:adenosylcobinamide-phosphate synthase
MTLTMDWFSLQPVLVLLAAVLTARLPLFNSRFHPMRLLGLLFTATANKVNNPKRSNKQHRIAGSLAIMILIVFMLIALGIFRFIAIESIIFDFLLLVCLLQWDSIKLTQVDLGNLEKPSIIEQLNDKTLRDLTPLSTLGLYKTTIESLCLRNAYQWFAVVFWYATLGIWAATGYRIIQLMAHNWNCKLPNFQVFGRPAALVLQLLTAPSHWLLGFTLSLFHQPVSSLSKGFRQAQQWHHKSGGFLLACFANSLSVQLGGPRKYRGVMTRFSQLGSANPPQKIDIKCCQQRLNFAAILWLTLLSTIYLFIAVSY